MTFPDFSETGNPADTDMKHCKLRASRYSAVFVIIRNLHVFWLLENFNCANSVQCIKIMQTIIPKGEGIYYSTAIGPSESACRHEALNRLNDGDVNQRLGATASYRTVYYLLLWANSTAEHRLLALLALAVNATKLKSHRKILPFTSPSTDNRH